MSRTYHARRRRRPELPLVQRQAQRARLYRERPKIFEVNILRDVAATIWTGAEWGAVPDEFPMLASVVGEIEAAS